MQRNLGKSDFDREWERARRFHRIFFAIVATLVVLIFAGTAAAIYTVATQPEIIGEAAGKIVNGYVETQGSN
ncbi:hypothetical protein vBCbaSRXM_45 [Citromicrobium phage vB_CbaS-RXM]|nr:hypothetical protein vBCbaSRXM_45 [Citromicrobium phage vB_CbaS-RXM]